MGDRLPWTLEDMLGVIARKVNAEWWRWRSSSRGPERHSGSPPGMPEGAKTDQRTVRTEYTGRVLQQQENESPPDKIQVTILRDHGENPQKDLSDRADG